MAYTDKPPLRELITSINMYDECLMHYGTPRHSGRYPWGSGDDPYQRTNDFCSRVDQLKADGLSEREIAKTLGITKINRSGEAEPSTTRLRIKYSVEKENRRAELAGVAKRLREKEGLTLREITEKMGFKNDSSVRALLDEDVLRRKNAAKETAEFLKQQVKEKGMIDVGSSVEYDLNITHTKLEEALYRLELEGYPTYGGRVPQATNKGQMTTIKVLCPPGTEHKEIYNYDKINTISDYISRDGGESFQKAFQYPKSMDSKRLMIRYKEDGGIDQDGIVQLKRGVDDLSLGNSHYAQVRILVDNDRYIKGMAIYADDKEFPPGIDVIFNTNKTKDVPMRDVLKKIKNDPDNPFGSAIKEHGGQYEYVDKNGKKQLGLINKRADEGDWSDWKDNLPAQFLSKQPLSLAKRQLGLAVTNKQTELDKIMELTNPTVKKKLLEDFANQCDSDAVRLRAAALPSQKYHVIIPITSMKDTEIYAPKYPNGSKVALIRYPHGGPFEIPILTVNNKHQKAKKLLGTDIDDAVGINSKVAERLSGADFDGDTVMVIPISGKNKINIKSTPYLEGLKGFDPKEKYGTTRKVVDGREEFYTPSGRKVSVMKNTQNQMGRISNLITDMTLRNATEDELAAAVRHSMVVIDAEKHKLDYKQSYLDNHIESLKKKYQTGGASTLISRAKSQLDVDKRRGSPRVNIKGKEGYDPTKPEGSLIYKTAYDKDLYRPDWSKNKKTGLVEVRTVDGKKISFNPLDKEDNERYAPIQKPIKDSKTGSMVYYNKDKTLVYRATKVLQKSTKMAETDDAYTLISDAAKPMEIAYADYANKMKAFANLARKEMATSGSIRMNNAAKSTYKKEVDSLNRKLLISLKNHPKERQANLATASEIRAKKQANPDMTNDEIKKASQQALTKYRLLYGAKREEIDIEPREWEAIQAGAISETTLKKILNRADMDKVRQLATPRQTITLSPSKISRIGTMKSKGYTIDEIANALGVSASTVSKYLR